MYDCHSGLDYSMGPTLEASGYNAALLNHVVDIQFNNTFCIKTFLLSASQYKEET